MYSSLWCVSASRLLEAELYTVVHRCSCVMAPQFPLSPSPHATFVHTFHLGTENRSPKYAPHFQVRATSELVQNGMDGSGGGVFIVALALKISSTPSHFCRKIARAFWIGARRWKRGKKKAASVGGSVLTCTGVRAGVLVFVCVFIRSTLDPSNPPAPCGAGFEVRLG